MRLFNSLEQYAISHSRVALTIGNFDGMHIGHQGLIKRLKEVATHTVVITFSNHPHEILHKASVPYLMTLKHRLSLLEQHGIESVFLIPFSETFAQQTAAEFLSFLKTRIPFTHLILGHDARIGHDKKKDLHALAQHLDFQIENIEPVMRDGKIVSSSAIRTSIQAGKLQEATLWLGRPYSVFATVQKGEGKGRALGFHTANLPVSDLARISHTFSGNSHTLSPDLYRQGSEAVFTQHCPRYPDDESQVTERRVASKKCEKYGLALPPFGVYAVQVKAKAERLLPGIANLGFAPTLHQNRPPCLEVHLIDHHCDLYGQELEVIFTQFLRPEKRFESPEALKAQIQKDIASIQSPPRKLGRD